MLRSRDDLARHSIVFIEIYDNPVRRLGTPILGLTIVNQMKYHLMMRTTLDIDADVLAAAKELADRERSTAGKVLSRLARQALVSGADAPIHSFAAEPQSVYGFTPFPSQGCLVTNELKIGRAHV